MHLTLSTSLPDQFSLLAELSLEESAFCNQSYTFLESNNKNEYSRFQLRREIRSAVVGSLWLVKW